MKKFSKAKDQNVYHAHVFVLFNKQIPAAMAQEASSAIFKDLVQRNQELSKIVEGLPRDAMMDMIHDCTAQEFPKEEFVKGSAQVLGKWAAEKMGPNAKRVPFVKSSSMQAVEPDGTRTEMDYAIAVVIP